MNIFRRCVQVFQEGKILASLVGRNIKIKYKDTWLGFVWVLLQPLCTIAILSFVFSHVIRLDIDKFPLFLCAGVLPWTYFASALTEATSSIVVNSNLVLKVNFPREVLPLSYCISNLFDFVFSILILLPVLYFFKVPLNPVLLFFLVPLMLFQLLFVFGLSMILSVLHVFYKDVGHLLSVVLMFWFYLTPIFYSLEHVPESLLVWYTINPMVYFVQGYRAVLFNNATPGVAVLGMCALIGLVSLLCGSFFFFIREKSVAKEL